MAALPGIGQTDDAHLQRAHLLDDVGLDVGRQLAGGVLHHVGRQEGELGLGHAVAQHLLAEIQVVVAHGGGIVAGDVHGLHHGGALGLVGAEGALPDVAGVQHQHLAAGVLAELVDVAHQVGQAAGLELHGADLHHLGRQGAVEVVGVQDRERLGGRRRRGATVGATVGAALGCGAVVGAAVGAAGVAVGVQATPRSSPAIRSSASRCRRMIKTSWFLRFLLWLGGLYHVRQGVSRKVGRNLGPRASGPLAQRTQGVLPMRDILS